MKDEDRFSGSAGGRARANKLTAGRRKEIARLAAYERWGREGASPPVLAAYGAGDRPVRIGDIEIPCYVLADGRRVLVQRGMQAGIGLSRSGGAGGARRIAVLLAGLERKGLDFGDLIARVNNPIRFLLATGGIADGYEATILPDVCAAILKADGLGKLRPQQHHLAERCRVLLHGFGTVGIIALVDEATGYQEIRSRDALAKILERFVAKELRPWIRTFPPEYYEEIFRLNNWKYAENCGRPGVLGHWTNNIVYKRLAPGVLEELKRVTPRGPTGRLRQRLFQRLTDDFGHPRLREHLVAVVMLMKYSRTWRVFMERLDKEFPQWGTTRLLPFPDDYEGPDETETSRDPQEGMPSGSEIAIPKGGEA